MTFQEIWNQLLRKEPSLAKPETTIEFKSKNLEALLRQVYEQGQKSVPAVSTNAENSMDMFDSILRGR